MTSLQSGHGTPKSEDEAVIELQPQFLFIMHPDLAALDVNTDRDVVDSSRATDIGQIV